MHLIVTGDRSAPPAAATSTGGEITPEAGPNPIDAVVGAFVGTGCASTAAVDLRATAEFEAAVDELVTAAASVPRPPVWASLTFRPGGGARTVTLAATHRMALAADQAQYAAGRGPSLDALATQDPSRPTVVDDVGADQRWDGLTFPELGLPAQPRAVLSCALLMPDRDRACLNLYSPVAGRWTDPDIDLARLIAHMVGAGLTTLLSRRRAAHLQLALDSNRLIGAALGLVMGRHLCTYDQAFDRLTATSQHLNRKLRDIAEDIVLTGVLPT